MNQDQFSNVGPGSIQSKAINMQETLQQEDNLNSVSINS